MKLRVGLVFVCALMLNACASMNAPPPDKYIVFFDFDSVELSQPALAIVAQATAEAKRVNPARIDIAGYPGIAEGARTGEIIATQRFEAVANALTAAGVDPLLIRRAALAGGRQLPAVAIRRIEVRFITSEAAPAS